MSIVLSTTAFAQDPHHFTIGSEELNNVDIYGITEDHDGRLFITSDQGLFVLRRGTFEKIEGAKEQKGLSLFQPKTDKNGAIFCCNNAGQIFKLVNGKLDLYYHLIEDKPGTTFSYFFDKNNDLICVSSEVYRIDVNSKTKETVISNPFDSEFNHAFLTGNTTFLEVRTSSRGYVFNGNKFDSITIPDFLFTQDKEYKSRYYRIPFGEEIIWSNQFGKVYTNDGALISAIEKEEQQDVYWLDNQNSFFRGEQNGLTHLFYNNEKEISFNHYFKDQFISTVYKSPSGVVYLGTFKQGVIVIPSLASNTIQSQYSHLTGIATSPSNELFFTSQNGYVISYGEDTFSILDSSPWSLEGIHYIEKRVDLQEFKHPNLVYGDLFNHPIQTKKIHCDHELLIYASLAGIQYARKDSLLDPILGGHRTNISTGEYNIFNSVPRKSNERCLAYSEVLQSYYLSNLESTISCYREQYNELLFEDKVFASNELICTSDTLVCGTSKHGVLLFKNDQFATQIKLNPKGKQPSILKMVLKKSLLYVLSTDGFWLVNVNTSEKHKLGLAHGMFRNDIVDFDVNDENIWFLEPDRVFNLPLDSIHTVNQHYHLSVDSIYVNEHLTEQISLKNLSFEDNDLRFFVSIPEVFGQLEGEIHYQLNEDEKWKVLSKNSESIDFQSLSPGAYLLKIKVVTANQESEVTEIQFVINPPFWQRWWFYAILFAAAVLIVALIYRRRLKIQAKEAKVKNELSAAKLTAIQSQMNPHFIFNSLNSIQHLVLKGESEKSYDYLTRFANLVRRTLDYSEKERITLEEEIQLLEVYLKLEKLRFKEDLEYIFTYNKEQIVGLQVPPMLIQPFIENALVHGLLHKKGIKQLRVSFDVGEVLTCIIEDNGIGREKAKEIRMRQRGNHQSFALEAIKRRFEILQEFYPTELGYEYEDVKNDELVTTRVILRIPLDIRKEK